MARCLTVSMFFITTPDMNDCEMDSANSMSLTWNNTDQTRRLEAFVSTDSESNLKKNNNNNFGRYVFRFFYRFRHWRYYLTRIKCFNKTIRKILRIHFFFFSIASTVTVNFFFNKSILWVFTDFYEKRLQKVFGIEYEILSKSTCSDRYYPSLIGDKYQWNVYTYDAFAT